MNLRLDRIDALRGVAALCVVVSHSFDRLTAEGSWNVGTTYVNAGYFGVCLFLLISGFLMTLSLERTALPVFWVRRLFRLYPAFWVSIIGAIVVQQADVTALQFAANATMVPQLFGQELLLIVYWTLSLELGFYVLMSVLATLRWMQAILPIAMILIVIGILSDHLLPSATDRPSGVTSAWVASNLAIMFTGAWIGQIWRGERPAQRSVLGFATLWAAHALTGILTGNGAWMLTYVLAGLVFGLVLRSRRRPPRLAVWLGTISYSLYLVHVLIIVLIPPLQPLAATAVWMLVSCGVAYGVHVLVERPGIALGRRIAERLAPGA